MKAKISVQLLPEPVDKPIFLNRSGVSSRQRIGLLGETLFLTVGLALMFFVKEERATAL